MKTLITNEQVISLAFGDGEYLSPEVILVSDITTAEHRYILPLVGEELYKALLGGSYATLLNDYVAPALAMSVRTVIQPSLNVRIGSAGLHIPTSTRGNNASRSATQSLHKSLRMRRQTLLRRLSAYLVAHASEFKEYNASQDIMQKCIINGGFIQTL